MFFKSTPATVEMELNTLIPENIVLITLIGRRSDLSNVA